MRITHVITRLIVGGAQENTIASVLGLGQTPGWSVDLVSGPTTGPEGSLEGAFDRFTSRLAICPQLVRQVHPLKDWLALKWLQNRFRTTRPEVVHTHSGKAGVLGRVAARRAGVPVIVHTIHGPSFGDFQGPVANLIFRSAERRAARVTDHFVVVCNAMKQQYLKAGIGSPDQYTRVFSGFPLEPFLAAKNDLALRARLGLAPSDIVVGKIARLFRLKGHEDLFTAAPEIVRHTPEVKFLLLGGGEWCDRFKSLARTQGLEKHFVFAGLVPPQEIARYVGIMDALVHLSRREGLARALPQALAAGKPVIAYDCDGAGEVCINGETGFLVPPGDLTALVRAVTTLAGDSALRRQLGERGRELVAERFSVENMVASLRQLYLRLVREPSHSPAPTA